MNNNYKKAAEFLEQAMKHNSAQEAMEASMCFNMAFNYFNKVINSGQVYVSTEEVEDNMLYCLERVKIL